MTAALQQWESLTLRSYLFDFSYKSFLFTVSSPLCLNLQTFMRTCGGPLLHVNILILDAVAVRSVAVLWGHLLGRCGTALHPVCVSIFKKNIFQTFELIITYIISSVNLLIIFWLMVNRFVYKMSENGEKCLLRCPKAQEPVQNQWIYASWLIRQM